MLTDFTWHSPCQKGRLPELMPRLLQRFPALTMLLSLLALTTPGPVLPQADPQPGFTDKVSVGYVLIPVIARFEGGYVRDLTADDFELRVDGDLVSFESFELGATAPISVIFLQDLSGSMANASKLRMSRIAVDRILADSRDTDQFALATFADGELSLDVPYTSNTEDLDRAMGVWKPHGVTTLHDAVYRLPELTQPSQSVKRAAILITDGADNSSAIDPGEARHRVRQAELPTYVLGLATGDPSSLNRDGTKLHRYADVLNLLAHLTGGQYFWISDFADVVGACDTIAADLRHQYVLGFSTSDTGESRYRELEVVVKKRQKKIRLSFRRGYQGRPPRFAGKPTM